jgi:leader peptidase (prepilin peptidase)/N-methyltransferase
MSIDTLVAVASAVLGLIVGSFLNVVIARVPEGGSVLWPGSRCPRCGRALAWYENVPLLSWLALRGRCRTCRAPISVRYPLVELLTGALFLAAALLFGPGWTLVRAFLLIGFLIPLSFIDLEHWIVPDELTRLGTAAGLLTAIPFGKDVVVDCSLGAVAGFFLFWALEPLSLLLVRFLRWLSWRLRLAAARLGRAMGDPLPEREPDPTEALGGGDKWILLLVGSFLGWRPLFGVLLLSAVQGSVVGIALLVVQGRAGSEPPGPGSPATEDGWTADRTALPYGPWLALAALELFLVGPWLSEAFPSTLMSLLTGRPWMPP